MNSMDGEESFLAIFNSLEIHASILSILLNFALDRSLVWQCILVNLRLTYATESGNGC
jgi:hypothetical protein